MDVFEMRDQLPHQLNTGATTAVSAALVQQTQEVFAVTVGLPLEPLDDS
jgi:hypothetical protein